MASILRAAPTAQENRNQRAALQDVAELAAAAQRCWEQAQTSANELLEQAREDAERIRREAFDDGFHRGRQAAEEDVRAELGRQLAEAPVTRDQIAAELRRAQEEWLSRWEQDGLRLACAIAARLVRREYLAEPRLTCGLIREALELAAGRQRICLHLHPSDRTLLEDEVRQLLQSLGRQSAVDVQSDDAVEPGSCRVVTEHGEIDQQWSAQLDRIFAELDNDT